MASLESYKMVVKPGSVKGMPAKKRKAAPGTVGGTNDVGVATAQGGQADPGTYGRKAAKGAQAPKGKIVKAGRGQLAKSMPKKPMSKRQQQLAVSNAAKTLVDLLHKAH